MTQIERLLQTVVNGALSAQRKLVETGSDTNTGASIDVYAVVHKATDGKTSKRAVELRGIIDAHEATHGALVYAKPLHAGVTKAVLRELGL